MDVTRICNCCGIDTPSLHIETNSRGSSVGLFGAACGPYVRKLVDRLAACHGAHIVNGAYLCSPRGTPDVTNVAELERLVGAAPNERPRCPPAA